MVRSSRQQTQLVQHLAGVVSALPDLTLVFAGRAFPQDEVVQAAKDSIPGSGLRLPPGYFRRAFLVNTLQRARNLVRGALKGRRQGDFKRILQGLLVPPTFQTDLERWLAEPDTLPNLLTNYLRALSRRLTRRVKELRRSLKKKDKTKRNLLGRVGLDGTIRAILQDAGFRIHRQWLRVWEGGRWEPLSLRRHWGKARKAWRDAIYNALLPKLRKAAMPADVTRGISAALGGFTPERAIAQLFRFRNRWIPLSAGDLAELTQFLEVKIATEAERRLVVQLQYDCVPLIQQILRNLQRHSALWVQRPTFKGLSIPFGIDDGQVYWDPLDVRLLIHNLERTPLGLDSGLQTLGLDAAGIRKVRSILGPSNGSGWISQPKAVALRDLFRREGVTSRHFAALFRADSDLLQVAIRMKSRTPPMRFRFRDPDRVLTLLDRGWSPARGTLIRKANHALVLAIPFTILVPPAATPEPSDPSQTHAPIGGLDLGLKTLGVLSIREGTQQTDGSWVGAKREIARYFLDQKQLEGSRNAWRPGRGALAFNWKRRLAHLIGETRRAQARLDTYKDAAQSREVRYRRKRRYFELRRRFRQLWAKVRQLHGELARQVATRVVAACQWHGVASLHLEDLRWAKPRPKYEAGYFLTANQVHWFHSQIQAAIRDRAAGAGFTVVWVTARYTSSSCSRCGWVGATPEERYCARRGKVYKCPSCGFQLDADLNAARNIAANPPHLLDHISSSPGMPGGGACSFPSGPS
jgi:predicted RNA-binding Zn-ribbon protein involved in translation (DUF1610 family)